jgi:hypothetical protein
MTDPGASWHDQGDLVGQVAVEVAGVKRGAQPG